MAGGCRPRLFDYAAIRELYLQDGQNGVTVAKHFGCSKTVVYDICADIKKRWQREQEWSDEQIETLRDLWGTMPTRKIAEALGRGKNAIIGKSRRLGLKRLENPVGRPKNPDAPKRPVPQRIRLAALTVARAAKVSAEPFLPGLEVNTPPNIQPRAVPKVRPESVQAVNSEPRRIPFHKLERNECQWFTSPITRHHAHEAECCGHEVVAGKPYCPFHTEKARGVPTQNLGNLDKIDNWSAQARRPAA